MVHRSMYSGVELKPAIQDFLQECFFSKALANARSVTDVLRYASATIEAGGTGFSDPRQLALQIALSRLGMNSEIITSDLTEQYGASWAAIQRLERPGQIDWENSSDRAFSPQQAHEILEELSVGCLPKKFERGVPWDKGSFNSETVLSSAETSYIVGVQVYGRFTHPSRIMCGIAIASKKSGDKIADFGLSKLLGNMVWRAGATYQPVDDKDLQKRLAEIVDLIRLLWRSMEKHTSGSEAN